MVIKQMYTVKNYRIFYVNQLNSKRNVTVFVHWLDMINSFVG